VAIRVLVVDDHTLVREGLVGLLGSQPDITVVGQAGSAPEALDELTRVQPDVVLMDVGLPGLGGLDATQEIRQRFPGVQVLIVTIHDREDYLFRALRAGAAGYVLKGAEVGDLLAAVRAASRGEVYLFPSVTKKLVADYLRRSGSGEEQATYDGLSEREREILSLIAEGMTSNEIATLLVLSPHTVQSHRDHIMAKLGLHTKAALIRYAIAHGLIDL
jgi:two-component system response regulator NreC